MKTVNYKQLKLDILKEHNNIRTKPQSYIPHLENQLKFFKGDVFTRPGEVGIQTNEGKAAVQEAINFLKKQKVLGPLEIDDNLCKAVQDHVNDIGPKGLTGHDGSDGSGPSDRVEKYCEWEGGICDNIDFGGKTGVDVILSLLIDDGVSTRGHRKNLFNEKIKYAGIGVGAHSEYEVCSNGVYCEGISGKKSGNIGLKVDAKVNSDVKGITNNLGKVNLNDEKKDKVKGLFDKMDKKAGKKEEIKNEEYDMETDPDCPEGAVGVDIKIKEKTVNGKKTTTTTKTYTMEDGSTESVEISTISK